MQQDHICVCICTYKRPASLKRLLEALQLQETDGQFEFSAVVVDNDGSRSAEQTVAQFQSASAMPVRYEMEPQANISLARNRTLELADGEYVAFIDDDEYPQATWLSSLYQAAKRFAADAVIGCVQPDFESEPPLWVRRGWFFFKPPPPLPPTGTLLSAGITSNALVSQAAIREGRLSFNPAFGRSGGEDDKFFRDLLANGFTIVFCGEAVVHEEIPADRTTVAYLWKRHHLYGQTSIRIARLSGSGTARLAALLKSLVATGLYILALPLLALRGRHVVIHYWLKIAWHLGFIAGAAHWRILQDRQQFEAYMQSAEPAQDEKKS